MEMLALPVDTPTPHLKTALQKKLIVCSCPLEKYLHQLTQCECCTSDIYSVVGREGLFVPLIVIVAALAPVPVDSNVVVDGEINANSIPARPCAIYKDISINR